MCVCVFFTFNENLSLFVGKNADPPKRVVDFPLERDTFRTKIIEIVGDFDEKSYNNNGKPWKSSRILRVKPNFFIYHCSSFFFIFRFFIPSIFSFFFIFHFLLFFHFFFHSSFFFICFHFCSFFFIFFLFLHFSSCFFIFLQFLHLCSFFIMFFHF